MENEPIKKQPKAFKVDPRLIVQWVRMCTDRKINEQDAFEGLVRFIVSLEARAQNVILGQTPITDQLGADNFITAMHTYVDKLSKASAKSGGKPMPTSKGVPMKIAAKQTPGKG